ncbi:hypothetical protein [Streptomyces sp. NPDC087300]|uniref:hypothetical protein n=1 Tax=Streptomyces sp. NPDC087300 TaxID=3365780 RepID=UPI0038028236
MPKRRRKRARTTTVPPERKPPPSRRRDAVTHLLRGTCYGLGTSLASLVVWWIQR